MSERKPIIAVTIGDPAGIGPENVVGALMEKSVYEECSPLVIGTAGIIQKALDLKDCNFAINVVSNPSEGKYEYGIIDLLEVGNYDATQIEYGKVQKLAGKMSYDYIVKAIELGKAGEVDGVGTAPIHKQAIKLAGVPQPGHTEIFGDLTNSEYALTMFNCHKLRVFFVSRHMALREACDFANKKNVLEKIEQIDKELKNLGISSPKIAVAALNPHGSDNGLFGTEEADELIPAVEEAQKIGINAVGPVPADSVFFKGRSGIYDAILSLYHDQGHIACKTLDFERSVTLTFGLPFLRSSVDHGTAFDIAGKNIAQSVSMEESILVLARYWKMRRASQSEVAV